MGISQGPRVNFALLICAGILIAQETATPVQHVVVIFQENVAFDHYFATYPVAANPDNEPFFAARSDMAAPGVNGLAGVLMASNTNSEAPFRLSRGQAVTCSQSHNYT